MRTTTLVRLLPAALAALAIPAVIPAVALVGSGFAGYTSTDAVVWQDGRTTVLPKLGGTAEASAVNNRGQVVGYSTITPTGTDTRAVLWTR